MFHERPQAKCDGSNEVLHRHLMERQQIPDRCFVAVPEESCHFVDTPAPGTTGRTSWFHRKKSHGRLNQNNCKIIWFWTLEWKKRGLRNLHFLRAPNGLIPALLFLEPQEEPPDSTERYRMVLDPVNSSLAGDMRVVLCNGMVIEIFH
ncbi:hypothetical protein AVEN_126025-1 [Araneus ventricosus]|uniref:Uncharacterized protein n=1 Tax=Araneus ventricosus TaxID=182803 RepID=A0A4Y2NIU6_ARAVE|nr:hypothetical protein AVEN_126025-1 [Araneus ventricosus]